MIVKFGDTVEGRKIAFRYENDARSRMLYTQPDLRATSRPSGPQNTTVALDRSSETSHIATLSQTLWLQPIRSLYDSG